MLPLRLPPSTSVKSPASTPLTSRLNFTRYTTLLATAAASSGLCRVTAATLGACVSNAIAPTVVSFSTYASVPPPDATCAVPTPGSKSTTPPKYPPT